MGGTVEYVYHHGQRLTAWMLYVILLLDADLFRAFGVHVLVSSAIRTYEEQKRIFLARYVRAADVNGRRVYDTRVWNGVRWYRISPAGTVAIPGYSNHEIQGTKAAVDIRDSGRDAGITSRNSVRGRWIRDWCRRTGLLIASGDSFGEGWHFDVPGIFRTPPALPSATPTNTAKPAPPDIMEAIRMAQIRYVHRAEPGYSTEWMIVGLEIPGGYEVTTDQTRAEGWGAVYGTDKGDSWKALTRKQYIGLQESARDLHNRWVALQKTLRS